MELQDLSAKELILFGLIMRGYLGTRIDMTNTKIDSTFKWLLGVQIAMWVTIIAAVLL